MLNLVLEWFRTITNQLGFYLNVPFQVDRSGKFPVLRFKDRDSYKMNKTKEYDDLAMKYLSYVLFFLVACASIYSLKYERHKSWYSWILSSLTQCVYMFGKCTLVREAPEFAVLLFSGHDNSFSLLFCLLCRLHNDVPPIIHKLQAEVSGSLTLAANDIQVLEHHYWRSICLCYQDAHTSSVVSFPWW